MNLENTLFALLAGIAGYFTARFFSGRKEGEQGRLHSWIFSAGRYRVHLHHWFIAALLLAGLWVSGWTPPLLIGFLLGLVVQGLTYKDFYRIVYKA